jgi:altronate hydrolase
MDISKEKRVRTIPRAMGATGQGGTAGGTVIDRISRKENVAYGFEDTGNGFMDTPGYDPVSVSGLVAGGAPVVIFTTGRGSVLGCKPTPSAKLGTNTELFLRQGDDVDTNAGRIADGTATVDEVGAEILDVIVAVASGTQTTSEEFDVGQGEFVPWHVGAVT